MEPDALAERLRPIRLPAEFAAFGVADALAAFSCGVLAAMLLALLLRPFVRGRSDPVAQARREIARLADAAPAARLVGLARLFDRLDPDHARPRPEALTRALYDPRAACDPATVERAIVEAVRLADGPAK